MFRKIIRFTIFLIGIYLIIGLSRDISRLWAIVDSLKLAEQKVKRLEEERNQLRQMKQYYSSPEFIEKEAREKLGMTKPGEAIVLLPTNLPQVLGRVKPKPEPEIPNWKKWRNLFF